MVRMIESVKEAYLFRTQTYNLALSNNPHLLSRFLPTVSYAIAFESDNVNETEKQSK